MPGTVPPVVFGGIFLGFRFRLPEGCGPSGQAGKPASHQAWHKLVPDIARIYSGKRRVFRSRQDY
jgi:hypothetical protein